MTARALLEAVADEMNTTEMSAVSRYKMTGWVAKLRAIASSLEGQADGEGIPEGYDVAGNFGNGKWYFTKDDHPQAYLGEGWDTRQGAIAAAIDAARTAQSKDKPA